MKKSKITLLILSVLFVTIICIGCSTTPPANLIIPPDPNNPFQGTWTYSTGISITYMLVIEGMNGTAYYKVSTAFTGWKIASVFTIERSGNEYRINGSPIRVNGNILIADNRPYERYVE